MENLKIEYVPINSVQPYLKNAKLHPAEQIEQIKKSIRDYGFRDPVGVWKGQIVEGHGRVIAARELGLTEIPIIRLDDMTDEQRREYALVHNQTTMNSGFDFSILDDELEDLPDFDAEFYKIDIADFSDDGLDFFKNRTRDDDSRQEGNEEYNSFLDKFEQPKTTDDCYTPDVVYKAVSDYVVKKYGVNEKDFVRPFYPGGDYKAYKYNKNSIVVDNPPFSILAEIVKFYVDADIKFFLFAPSLTIFSSSSSSSSCAVCVGADVTYENKATVSTSFLTNLEKERARTAPDLYKALKDANDEYVAGMRRELPKYEYPNELITSSKLAYFSKYGIEFSVSVSESARIGELDEQKKIGKSIYGSGYLISEKKAAEKAAAEKAAAEKAAAEKAAAEKWVLSEREWDIVHSLG